MAAQATAAMRRTLGGAVAATLCAGGLLAGAAGAPLAQAAVSIHIGEARARVQPDPTRQPGGQRGDRPSAIPDAHPGRVVPDPIYYPNRAGSLVVVPAACSGGCGRVVGDYIGETEAQLQPDPTCAGGCHVGVGGSATRDPGGLHAAIPPDPCRTAGCGGMGGPTARGATAFRAAGEVAVQPGARRNPMPALNPQPLPPRGDD